MNPAAPTAPNPALPGGRRAGFLQAAVLALLGLAAVACVWLFEEHWSWNLTPRRIAAAGSVLLLFLGAWAWGGWRRRQQALAQAGAQPDAAQLGIFHASQTGLALQLAEQSAQQLRQAGLSVHLAPLAQLRADHLARLRQALFLVSTSGEGDAPDAAAVFVRDLLEHSLPLPRLRFGLLALGDRSYTHFCGFGRRLDAWLQAQGARPLFPAIEVDRADAMALHTWQTALAASFGLQPQTPQRTDQPWRLLRREQLNPGSLGAAIFHLELRPESGELPHWEAGDIAVLYLRHTPETVAAWLAALAARAPASDADASEAHASEAHACDGDAEVETAQGRMPLAEYLRHCELPDPSRLAGSTPQAIADALIALRPREYSIASLPADGCLALLVRQVRHPDGSLGLASGELTARARIGDCFSLALRRNPGFRVPEQDRPLILIGNGSGLAGLRALLRARIAQGRHHNWLLFGERQRAHDFLYREELQTALAAGQLLRLDLAFSRDGAGPVYVQHLLQNQAERLREWVQLGAVLCVCGSREGMAAGVDAVLREILGAQQLQQLSETGRYRRDVY